MPTTLSLSEHWPSVLQLAAPSFVYARARHAAPRSSVHSHLSAPVAVLNGIASGDREIMILTRSASLGEVAGTAVFVGAGADMGVGIGSLAFLIGSGGGAAVVFVGAAAGTSFALLLFDMGGA